MIAGNYDSAVLKSLLSLHIMFFHRLPLLCDAINFSDIDGANCSRVVKCHRHLQRIRAPLRRDAINSRVVHQSALYIVSTVPELFINICRLPADQAEFQQLLKQDHPFATFASLSFPPRSDCKSMMRLQKYLFYKLRRCRFLVIPYFLHRKPLNVI